ncbi:MAG: large-conductance mechanosensitive channel protein MscL [Saprospiraceae bacterium]|nr:large-conductance mechanosensitive channel protein MscL [Saprospiraceae bacterium]MDC3220047.1 large-conductance mechanosensitive channel protein MscL [Saprospiraceae bacterium]MDG1432650.1 large-conductance mechanosensitive channel protein MscL [Saprospiraceae bacterium]MDG2418120.1 large-conductance mechanosensitive channel protein MscL [Saprospiraceae bacterium]
MRNFFNEFKEFALKGNMIDIAIGVIIGSAFNKVVDALVKHVFLPPLSFLTDGVSFGQSKLVLREEIVQDGKTTVEEISIGYGKFIEASIDFFIIALTVFMVVKVMNQLKNKAEDAKDKTVKTPKDIELLTKMTDLLEKQNEMLSNKKAN